MGLKSGKYNKKRWVPHDAARTIVTAFGGITSRKKYWVWHDKHKPLHLPKYPNRTYPEWVSWNDFLQVDNSFEKEVARKRAITRRYWEAVRWVQAQNYKDANDYKKNYEDGNVPLDIPKAPHAFYDEWQGWGVWLGTNVRSYIMSKSESLDMIAVCSLKNIAGNMIEVVYCADGAVALQQLCSSRDDLQPLNVYHVDNDDERKAVGTILEQVAKPQGGNVYIVPFLHELTFELSAVLREYVAK